MSAPFECGCVWTEEKPAWCALCCRCNDHCSCRKRNEIFQDLVRKHALAIEGLTEKQFAEAIRQAIACGDFQRLVTVEGSAQQVIYIPFQTEQRLRARIEDLEKLLERGSRCAICGEFYPGHATGGADICTCV